MSKFKFAPNLFLEVVELNKFASFLDTEGFRKNLLQDTVSYGLIKKNNDLSFLNGRVERDLDTTEGDKTIKIRELQAIDNEGLFLSSPQISNVIVPDDGRWYWVKVKHLYNPIETGKVSLAVNGDLTGVGTKFTESLRGMPNFPLRIRFDNSEYNTLEYDVLEVIDDEHAIVMHPALTGTGVATFEIESNLNYSVVGSFTPGVSIDQQDKYPFQYDSISYQLVQEDILNNKPTYIADKEFYLARVKVDDDDIIIQDKRTEYWQSQGKITTSEIENKLNPLIGIESVKWQNLLSPSDINQAYISWGMRSQNWAVDSSKNIVTLFGSATGGKFKTVDDFTNGDFDGWRIYTSNGKFSKISSSIKQGQAINLTLDVLDVDNYSSDGGITFNNQDLNADWILVVPDAEEIEIQFTTPDNENTENVFRFPINTLVGRCDIQVYNNPTCLFNVTYRYKTHKIYTEYTLLPSDPVGYYTETSFDENGNLKTSLTDRVLYPYVAIDQIGYIQFTISSNAYSILVNKIYKGDFIGVQTVSTFNTLQVYDLKVGRDKWYQFINGNITLLDDIYINLNSEGAVEGNEFRIHFNCSSLLLNDKNIFIVRDYIAGSTPTIIKTITQRDVYHMMNQDGGLVFDCLFSDTNSWNVAYQNYILDRQGEIITLDGVINDLFDTDGLGKIKGYFGIALCDGRNTAPNLVSRFIMGAGDTDEFITEELSTAITKSVSVGDSGGFENTVLVEHSHDYTQYKLDQTVAPTGSGIRGLDEDNEQVGDFETSTEGESGEGKNYSPYYALIFAKTL